MRFREHKRELTDSLATIVDLPSRAALVAQLNAMLFEGEPPIKPEDVMVEPYCDRDDRLGWKDVHIVSVKGRGVFGFCEGPCPS